MAIGYGSSVVRDGLVLDVDSFNVKSYSGTGNNVTNLADDSDVITFINTPLITDNSFDFTTAYSDGLSVSSQNYTYLYDFTMETLAKPTATHYHYDGALISSGNWNSAHWSLSLTQNNANIRTRNPSKVVAYNFTVNQWYHIVYRRIGTSLSFFVNGVNISTWTDTTSIPLASDAGNTTIGRETYAGGYFSFTGNIAVSRIYSRGLSDSEVEGNFNALRWRYGI